MQSTVIASLRSQTSGGEFNDTPAQQEWAAAPTLFLNYYDNTATGDTDYMHVFNPNSNPATGSISMSCVSPSQTFSLAPSNEQAFSFTNPTHTCNPITIQTNT